MKTSIKPGSYKELAFPIERKPIIDSLDVGARKHYVKALLELDVTGARNAIKDYRNRRGEGLSFLAWFLTCVAKACSEFPEVHAWRQGRRKLVVFDDVDISITVEREIEGERVPLPFIIRKTNIKSPTEIHREIRNAQTGPLDKAGVSRLRKRLLKSARLPEFLRRRFWLRLMYDAYKAKREMGTVMVVALNLFGKVSGWPLPTGLHPLVFGLGSIVKKPWIVGGKIEAREILNLTVMFDHDVVDGAPAARFLARLTRIVKTPMV